MSYPPPSSLNDRVDATDALSLNPDGDASAGAATYQLRAGRQPVALIRLTIYSLLTVVRSPFALLGQPVRMALGRGSSESSEPRRESGRAAQHRLACKGILLQLFLMQSLCPGKGSSPLSYPKLQTLRWMPPELLYTRALNSALPGSEGAQASPLPGAERRREAEIFPQAQPSEP